MIISNNNIMMPNHMLGLNLMDMNNNDEGWLKGFKIRGEEVNYIHPPKINIIFKTTRRAIHIFTFDYGTTIDEV